MRMKEDAMGNGQLKPAFNLQHGVDAEYIVWLTLGPQPTDTATLIPFFKEAGEYLSFKHKKNIADAGYESEENYAFLDGNQQLAYIKPSNYEISKTRKYKNDIGRMKNMDYDDYWAMAAALDLHREVALPVPLHKGLRPLYSPPHQLTLMRFCKIFCQKILQKNSRHPIQLFHKSFDCRLLYLP